MNQSDLPLCLQSAQTLFSGRLISSLRMRACLSVVALSCGDMVDGSLSVTRNRVTRRVSAAPATHTRDTHPLTNNQHVSRSESRSSTASNPQ